MTHVVLGIGSNIERETNIHIALKGLGALGPLEISPVVESAPVGYDSMSYFYNLVIGVETALSLDEVRMRCKELERQSGRRSDEPRFSPKTLDIDLLLWGDTVTTPTQRPTLPHPEILRYAHVLCPLALLYPSAIHPVTGTSYQALWAERCTTFPPLVVLDFPTLD